MKASTSSWDDGENPSGARRNCGGMKVYKLRLEKTKAKHHRRTKNGAIAEGGKRLEEADLAGQSRPKEAKQRDRCSREKKRGKKKKWRGRGEEGENKISPPSPGQNRTKAMEQPH